MSTRILSGTGSLHGLGTHPIRTQYRIFISQNRRTGIFSLTGSVDLPIAKQLEALNDDGPQTLELKDGRRVEARYFGKERWQFNGLEGCDV